MLVQLRSAVKNMLNLVLLNYIIHHLYLRILWRYTNTVIIVIIIVVIIIIIKLLKQETVR